MTAHTGEAAGTDSRDVARIPRPGAEQTDPASPIPIPARTRPLRLLAAELEASDPYTSGHSRRVSRYTTLVGSQLGLSGGRLRRLRTAAMLHDIGKIGVPREVLHKPGRLTEAEFEMIKQHAARGAELIDRTVGDDELSTIVMHHHERVDGGGYPSGLIGDAIPLGSRIVAVADTFDAIASRRPYRRAGSFQDALDALIASAGTQLDTEVVAGFCTIYDVLPGMGSLDLLSDAGESLIRGARWRLNADTPAGAAVGL